MRLAKYLFSFIVLARLIGVTYFWLVPEVLLRCTRRKRSERLEVAQRGGSHRGSYRGVPQVLSS